MQSVLLVGLGGGVGAILRYWISGLMHEALRGTSFPVGTLTVNVTGCLAVGVLAHLAETRGPLTPEARLLLITGLLGGFTTFSTFGSETVSLARGGEAVRALAYVGASVGLGLAGVWAGRALAQWVWR